MNQSRPPYASSSILGIPHIPTIQPPPHTAVPQPAYTMHSFNYSPPNIRNQHAPSTYNYPPAAPIQPARSFTPHPNNNPAPITPPTTEVVPYQAPVTAVTPVVTPDETTTPSKKSSNFNIGDIKGFIDRMGGIDGLVSTMQKVQKVVQGFQQIAPVAKLLVGSFASGKSKNKDEDNEEMFYTPTKKRPKKKQPQGSKRRPAKKTTSNQHTQRPKKGTAKASTRQKSGSNEPQIF